MTLTGNSYCDMTLFMTQLYAKTLLKNHQKCPSRIAFLPRYRLWPPDFFFRSPHNIRRSLAGTHGPMSWCPMISSATLLFLQFATATYSAWWFFATPLKNDGMRKRQLGWWFHSQCMESHNPVMFQSPSTSIYIIGAALYTLAKCSEASLEHPEIRQPHVSFRTSCISCDHRSSLSHRGALWQTNGMMLGCEKDAKNMNNFPSLKCFMMFHVHSFILPFQLWQFEAPHGEGFFSLHFFRAWNASSFLWSSKAPVAFRIFPNDPTAQPSKQNSCTIGPWSYGTAEKTFPLVFEQEKVCDKKERYFSRHHSKIDYLAQNRKSSPAYTDGEPHELQTGMIKIPLNFFVTVLSLNLQTSQKTFSTLKRNSSPLLFSSLEKDDESTHLPTPRASRSWICCCSSSSLEGTS